VLIAVPAYATIVVITISTGIQAQVAWFPLAIVVTILAIGISVVTSAK
jgi:hypothetical protein